MNTKKIYILIAIFVVLLFFAYYKKKTPNNFIENTDKTNGTKIFSQVDVEKLTKIEIQKAEEINILKKEGDRWLVETKSNFPADSSLITAILEILPVTNKINVASTNPEKTALYEVDEKGAKIKLYEGEKIIADFILGKPDTTFRNAYLKLASGNEVFLVDKNLRLDFSRDEWRDKEIYTLPKENVNKIEFIYSDQRIVVEKEGNEWLAKEPAFTLDKVKWNDFIAEVILLTAEGFADGLTTEQVGIASPVLTIKVFTGDSVQEILIGNKVPQTEKHYVKIPEKEMIYILRENTSKLLISDVKDLKK